MNSDLFLFAGGLCLLAVGAEALVRGASRLALSLGISPLVVGLTVVAFGTSAPEIAVAVDASLAGNPSLAIGNVIDTQAEYPDTVVASAIWHFEPTLQAALSAISAGSFTAANYGVYSFMNEGGCSLAPLGTFEGKVPEEALAMVAEKEAAIKAGDLVVEINDEEPTSS